MSNGAYKVVVLGVLDGRDREEVKKNLAVIFKKSPEEMEKFLSGKPMVAKKDVDQVGALKYKQVFQKAGAKVVVKPMDAAPGGKPTPAGKPAVAPAKAPKKMSCPKCCFEQPEALSCVKCGIAVEKYKKMQAEKAAAQKPAPPPLPPAPPAPPVQPDDGFARPGMPGHPDFHVGMHLGEEDKDPINFMAELPKVFAYPFSGNGKFIIIAGMIFFLILDVLSILPGVGLIAQLLVSGYIAAYFLKVISESADGRENPPEWPGFSGLFESIILPIVHLVVATLVSYSFAILYIVIGARYLGGVNPGLVVLLVLFGSIYNPMAVLAVAMSGRSISTLPMVVVPAMLRAPADYAICLLAYLVVVIVRAFASRLLALPVPLVGSVIQYFVMLYFLMVTARLLGNFYNANQEKLNWYVD